MPYSHQPLVSVVIPCYNHEQFIQDAIQSVIDQDYENIELIIIDDGSQDNSVLKIQEMMESCKKRFVRFEFRSRSNVGLSATLNEGLKWSEGLFFSPIASDDIYVSNKISIQIDYLLVNNHVVGLSGNIIYIDENNLEVSKTSFNNRVLSFENIITHNYFLPASSQIIKTSIIRGIGGYDESLLIEDWDMWLRLSLCGEIHFIANTLSYYRMHNNNTSSDFISMNRERLSILKKYKNKSVYNEAFIKTIVLNFKQANPRKISFIKKYFFKYS